MMEEGDYNDWSFESCPQCSRLIEEVGYLEDEDELQTKWFCVGRMVNKSEDPDEHEEANEIRVCFQGSMGIESWEWTPFEASRVGLGLIFAVSTFLVEGQPCREDEG